MQEHKTYKITDEVCIFFSVPDQTVTIKLKSTELMLPLSLFESIIFIGQVMLYENDIA